MAYGLSHLDALEAESIHIFREVAAEFERPVLLFSGGKDSIVMLRLAEKAFWPCKLPFPVMHVDTGHNFPEVIEFRDRRVAELGARLVIASVQADIDAGRAVDQTGARASRNQIQTVSLLREIEENRFGFEPEITAKVAALRCRIYEVGVSYSGRTYAEGKKIGWKDGMRAVVCIFKYSPIGQRWMRRR